MGQLLKCLGMLVALGGLAGCELLSAVATSSAVQPRQVMLASAPGIRIARGVLVSTYALPHGFADIGIEDSAVVGDGGMLPTEGARPGTAPGIAADDSIYVVAYWGGQPDFNFLQVLTSASGGRDRTWSRAGSLFAASSSQIDGNSRPALVFFPPTGTWFYAFRDANSGTILVDQLRIFDTGQFDSRSERIFNATQITRVDTRLASARPPALSYIGTTLVLAFTSGGIVDIAMAVNSPGSASPSTPYEPTFGTPAPATTTIAAVQARNSTAVVSDAGAPYLHNILQNIYLATARETPQGSVDIHVLQSGDGLAWNTEVATLRGVATTGFGGPVDPSIAGPPSEMVVAYRAASTPGTVATVNGGPFALDTRTNQSVGAAYGPGPSVVERLSCAEPSLVVRGSAGDTAVPAGRSTTVSTNGNPTLLCGANATIDPQCPASTSLITITRPLASSNFGLRCWPR